MAPVFGGHEPGTSLPCDLGDVRRRLEDLTVADLITPPADLTLAG